MPGPLHALDWAILVAYVAFALWTGLRYAGRAGQDVGEYFLSGRSLPWWVAGTSMVATSFAADTPLLITGWVREEGIWKNWVWWCYAIAGVLQVFLFARWWRRTGVMTKAEFVELRYGGRSSRVLRLLLAALHAFVKNTWTLCWVMLAAAKISIVLFEVDKVAGLTLACLVAMSYCLLAGFWGVVVTDMVQFAIAMVGAIALGWITWGAVGGGTGIWQAVEAGRIAPESLRMLPVDRVGGEWSAPFAAFLVYLGVAWWAAENVDSSGAAVQRVAASRDDRQGMLSILWFTVAHYALRPWCWIVVGLSSLIVLPHLELHAPAAAGAGARVVGLPDGDQRDGGAIVLEAAGGERLEVPLAVAGSARDWYPLPRVEADAAVDAGDLLAATDHEHAYMVMMLRFLPVGLLGLVAASLVAAFMSTIDTHVNLAASFFVNDIYRRFLKRDASERHYVAVARVASLAVLLLGTLIATQVDSLRTLFVFFLAFLAGVGPVYVLRWLWWRIGAVTEITAIVTSALVSTAVTVLVVPSSAAVAPWQLVYDWNLGPYSDHGALTEPGRLVVVALASILTALLSLVLAPRPDPRRLVPFFHRTRPFGAWGPVRALVPAEESREAERLPALIGFLGGLGLVFGLTLGIGYALLDRPRALAVCAVATLGGTLLVAWALGRMGHVDVGEET